MVSINFYNGNILLSSGSGFIYRGCLVSNNHVFNPRQQPLHGDTKVICRFGDTGLQDPNDIEIRYRDLELIVGSSETSHDYIVYRMPNGLNISQKHTFKLDHSLAYEGQQVLILGYPFGLPVMTSHVGYISAIYEQAGVKKLVLDASVNAGNSGGPLLDLETGNVLGIVTRKHSGLSEQFDKLIESFNENVKALSAVKGSVILSGIDPIMALRISQEQMAELSEHIRRSSNVGIGYAFSTRSLENEEIS